MFDQEAIAKALNARGWELPFVLLDEIDSTNLEAKRHIREGNLPDGGLILTDRQTAGKGRLDRSWFAAEGKDLTFTLGFKNELNRIDIPKMSLAAALGICQVLETDYAIQARMKWPNDVLIGDEKVAGILSEYVTPEEFIIIGVGINVNSGKPDWDFPTVVPPTSLMSALGNEVDRVELLASCAVAMRDFIPFARWEYFPSFQTLYGTRAFYDNRRVTIYQDAFTAGAQGREGKEEPDKEHPIEGIALGIDRYGALIVRDDGGTDHSVRAGDLVVVKE